MILTEQKIINEVLERNEKDDAKIHLTDDKITTLEYIMLFEMISLSDTHGVLIDLPKRRKEGDVWKTQMDGD